MRVLLDDSPIEVEPATIERAFEVGREEADARGRIVIEVLGDGLSIDQAMIENPPADSGGFAELKLVTADPGVFVSVTLTDSAAVLDEAARAQRAVADELLAGRVEGALEPMQAALSAWAVVRDVVDKSAAILGMDTGEIDVGGVSGSAIIDGLADRLGEIRRALGEQDHSALADVMAYDMPEQVERWRGLLTEMATRAAGGGAG